MSSAMMAKDFGALPIGIGDPFHSMGQLVVKARPAATGRELVFGDVEGRVASFTNKNADLIEMVIYAASGTFCLLAGDDPFFFWRELVMTMHRLTLIDVVGIGQGLSLPFCQQFGRRIIKCRR